jgi:hypothetical protein
MFPGDNSAEPEAQRKCFFPMDSNMAKSDAVYLPKSLADKVAEAPEVSYGVAKVIVILKDGRRFADVEVAWDLRVLRCEGGIEIPFSGSDVLEIEKP